jgi:hypothetical protein
MTEDKRRRRKAMTEVDRDEDRVGMLNANDEYTSLQQDRVRQKICMCKVDAVMNKRIKEGKVKNIPG